MRNEDGSCTVVQNGEIYNYAELNRELARAGHRIATHSDTETIVHAYEQWGLGFAERLRGMFAIAIWDAGRRRLVLARDRFGIKPLYYRHVAGLASGRPSELDALPHGELDLDSLEAFLASNAVPGPRSIFADIRKKLPPGEAARARRPRAGLEARTLRVAGLRLVAAADEAELVESAGARLADSIAGTSCKSPTFRSASCSREGSTRGCSPPWPRSRARRRFAPSRSGSRSSRSTSSRGRGRCRVATGRSTASSSCAPTPPPCCPPSPRPSTSRSRTPRRCPPTSSRSSPRRRSR